MKSHWGFIGTEFAFHTAEIKINKIKLLEAYEICLHGRIVNHLKVKSPVNITVLKKTMKV